MHIRERTLYLWSWEQDTLCKGPGVCGWPLVDPSVFCQFLLELTSRVKGWSRYQAWQSTRPGFQFLLHLENAPKCRTGWGEPCHLLTWDWSTNGMWVPEVFCFPNISRHQILIKGDLRPAKFLGSENETSMFLTGRLQPGTLEAPSGRRGSDRTWSVRRLPQSCWCSWVLMTWKLETSWLLTYRTDLPSKEEFVSTLDSTRKRTEVWIKREWEAIIADHVYWLPGTLHRLSLIFTTTLQGFEPITVPILQMREQVHGGQVLQSSLYHQVTRLGAENNYHVLGTCCLFCFTRRISFILTNSLRKQVWLFLCHVWSQKGFSASVWLTCGPGWRRALSRVEQHPAPTHQIPAAPDVMTSTRPCPEAAKCASGSQGNPALSEWRGHTGGTTELGRGPQSTWPLD